MKHKKHKDKSEHERKKSKKKHKKKNKKEKYNESDTSSSSSDNEQEWVEKPVSSSASSKETTVTVLKEQESLEREDWMNMKSAFPCVFKEKKTESFNSNKNSNKPDLDTLGQSHRELNPYWKNGGNGLPAESSMESKHVMDVKWLKKSLQRAKEQAASENRSLEEIAAKRWGSLEVIQSMISKAERTSIKKIRNDSTTFDKAKHKYQSRNAEKYGGRQPSSSSTSDDTERIDRYKHYDDSQYASRRKQSYKKPMNDDYFNSTSYKTNHLGKKNWQKRRTQDKIENNQSASSTGVVESACNDNAEKIEVMEMEEIKPLTEAEMNKLGAKIVKAEIMGNTELADELKLQLKKARDVAKTSQLHNAEKVQNVILTRTDEKGVTRPLESRRQCAESSQNIKRKNAETHVSGKKVRHYFDDDKYSLQQLFQREKGRSTHEEDAEFVKVASKNMDMEEIFEERITHVKSTSKQDTIDRSHAIKEHKRLSKSLDTCHWCIDSKYMLKHMVIAMDSEICLSLPQYTSLTVGHCILTPTQHIACQLQLDENVWDKLKLFKRTLYRIFTDQNQYPVFYEIYKSRHKFPHMKLECVPLPRKAGELAPMYFKKALLECETEWSMNKKVIDLEQKDVRQAIPNGLSYFMVEFERNKGYAHIIEDEHMFPKNFAEEIIGGMLDLDHDIWRKAKKQSFEQQREKVLEFSEIWKKYESETKYS